MLAAPAPLMSTDGNVRTRRSRRGGRRCHARRSSPEAHSAARWPALVHGCSASRACVEAHGHPAVLDAPAGGAREDPPLPVALLDAQGRHARHDPRDHGRESLSRPSFLTPTRLRGAGAALAARPVDLPPRQQARLPRACAARTSSRHVLDWLRKPFCGGPHWLHQDRIQFWLDADGGRSWDYPDSEEDSEDYNTDGSDDLDLPEHLRPSDAEMARRAARYPLPI